MVEIYVLLILLDVPTAAVAAERFMYKSGIPGGVGVYAASFPCGAADGIFGAKTNAKLQIFDW